MIYLPHPDRSPNDTSGTISIIPIKGIGEVKAGDNIADLICANYTPKSLDILVVTQKIVSKAENRIVHLDKNIDTSSQLEILIERESKRILRKRGTLMICETHSGYICANAGIDQSNMPDGTVGLLPKDPDRSARRIRDRIRATSGIDVGVIISDTFGRAWRRGVTDIALGVAGVAAIVDLRGTLDASGRVLNATEVALADEIAGAAELAKPKASNIPVVVVRGIAREYFEESSIASDILRPFNEDLFR